MGSTTYPAASSGGGGGAPFPNAGELVSSGTIGNKGFFLSDVLSPGNYIVTTDLRDYPDQYDSSYISINAFNSGLYTHLDTVDSSNPIRIKITESERIAVSAPWIKVGAEYYGSGTQSMYIGDYGPDWTSRSNYNNKFYNTDKYYHFWGTYNNGTNNIVSYHDFANMSLDAPYNAFATPSTDDSSLGGSRPQTAGGIVGNYAYFSFLQDTAGQRIWRANLSTPTTWTVGTTAATTDGFVTGIAYNGTTYVLVTSTGAINTSPDFSTWTKQTSPVTSIRDITFSGGQFVVVGMSGMIATSSNGFAWTKRTAPAGVVHLHNVNYIGGKYIAIGGEVDANNNQPWRGKLNGSFFAKSSDGITWTSFDLQPTKAARDAVSTYKYSSYQEIQRYNYQNAQNQNYGCNNSYVYNGYLYVDTVGERKFVTADGDNWYCLQKTWNNSSIITTPSYGQITIEAGEIAGRPGFYTSRPQIDGRVFVYAELP